MRCFIVWIQHLSDNLELIMLYLSNLPQTTRTGTKGKDASYYKTETCKGPCKDQQQIKALKGLCRSSHYKMLVYCSYREVVDRNFLLC